MSVMTSLATAIFFGLFVLVFPENLAAIFTLSTPVVTMVKKLGLIAGFHLHVQLYSTCSFWCGSWIRLARSGNICKSWKLLHCWGTTWSVVGLGASVRCSRTLGRNARWNRGSNNGADCNHHEIPVGERVRESSIPADIREMDPRMCSS